MAAFLVAAGVPLGQASADPARVALVIGEANYASLPALPACSDSARIVAAALGRAGFQVAAMADLTDGEFGAALSAAGEAAAKPGVTAAIVYICGYAVDYAGRPFLLPKSADIKTDTDTLTQGIVAKSVVNILARMPAALILLDVAGPPAGPAPASIAALANAGPAAGPGIAAWRTVTAGPQGPTPFAAAAAMALGGPEIEIGATIETLRKSLVAESGGVFSASARDAPVWLVGGPRNAPPAPGTTAVPAPSPGPAMVTPAPQASAPSPGEDSESASPADRRHIEEALQRLGYYPGPIDGVIGPDARAAIRRYQHEIGADMTGRLTPDGLQRLFSDRH